MKTTGKFILIGMAALASATILTNAETITDYMMSRPLPLLRPAMTDSLNNAGSKFDIGKMLESKSNLPVDKLGGVIITTDTTGTVNLTPAENGTYLTILETHLRPERFIKGSLKVTSPQVFEVMINGESRKTKECREDSICAASTVSVPLELQPETDCQITLRVLTDADDVAEPTISATFVPEKEFEDVAFTLAPEMKKRFQIQATDKGCKVTSVSLSPDGKYLLVRYREKFNEKNTRTWAELLETTSGKIVASNLRSSITWMPRGSKLYYTEAVNNAYDVFTIDVPTMKHERAIADLCDARFTWSPDGSYLLYYKQEEGKKESGPLRRYTNPDDRMPGNRDRSYLLKYDLATGMSYPLVYSKASTFLLDISADSEKVLYMTQVERPEEYPYYFFDVIQMDTRTLATDTIISNEGCFTGAIFSPDAKQLFVWAGPDFHGGIGLMPTPDTMPNNYDLQGYIVDIATKDVTPLTRDFDPAIENVIGWNDKDGKIYVMATVGFDLKPFAIDPKKKTIKELESKVDYVSSCSIGDQQDSWMAYCGSGWTYGGRAYLLNLKNGVTRTIDAPFDEVSDNINWGDMQSWQYTAKDGTVIDGYCVLPPDFDSSKKYPLIVYYYGGCVPTNSGITSPYSPQLFASRDYVVYVLNPSGTTGYGQEFSSRHVNAWGKYTADDIIEGTKRFCDEHPFVDRDKIGCIGASYGGFMTQYLLTQTDIFSAAVSHAGISNVASYWGEGYWGYSYNAVAASKSYPWNNPDLFTKQGSLFNADKIHTPLLLLHGTVDTNVPIGESIQLFNALKLLGRDVEFISVEGENHFIADFPKRELWHATIMAWFAKWLQDDPRWWDSLYGK